MGIRIHKKLGWGFDNVIENDPRFKYNPHDGELLEYLESRKQEYTDYLKSTYREIKKGKAKNYTTGDFWYFLHNMFSPSHGSDEESGTDKPNLNFFQDNLFDLYNSIITPDDEMGLSNVFLVQPIAPIWGKKDTYSRYDDSLDAYELAFSLPDSEVYEPKVVSGRWSNIYPYCNFNNVEIVTQLDDLILQDANHRPIYRMKDDIFNAIREINAHIQNKTEFKIDTRLLQESSGSLYTYKEYKKFVYPDVPETIVNFLWFMNIFVDPRDNLRLKPMVYRYWS